MRVTAGVSLHKWTHTMSPSVLATCLMQIEVLAGEMLPRGLDLLEPVQTLSRFKWGRGGRLSFAWLLIIFSGLTTGEIVYADKSG